jgi:hypothetical protein
VPQPFDLSTDPDEQTSLWSPSSPIASAMETSLRSAIDYPSVSMDVTQYQLVLVDFRQQ